VAEHGAVTSVAGPKTLLRFVRRFAAEGGSLRDGIWNDRRYGPNHIRRKIMGRGILLWLLGVPIPIIILLALFWH
jgi:hypothetical protein